MILHISTGDFLHDLLTPSVEAGFAFLLVLIGVVFIALAVRARRRADSGRRRRPDTIRARGG